MGAIYVIFLKVCSARSVVSLLFVFEESDLLNRKIEFVNEAMNSVLDAQNEDELEQQPFVDKEKYEERAIDVPSGKTNEKVLNPQTALPLPSSGPPLSHPLSGRRVIR